MSFVGDFIGDTIGGITGSKQQGKAAERAAQIQAGASDQAIAEQRRQFDTLIELMSPYVTSGNQAIGQQGALIGLGGQQAQQDAISQLEQSPMFTSLLRQGENAMLQNASATGGLRGGNTQSALMQFRPDLLAQVINDQYSKLGGLTQIGQASAAGQASAGMQNASNIGALLADRGAALAGGQLAKGSVVRQTFGDILALMSVGSKAMSGGAVK